MAEVNHLVLPYLDSLQHSLYHLRNISSYSYRVYLNSHGFLHHLLLAHLYDLENWKLCSQRSCNTASAESAPSASLESKLINPEISAEEG